MFSIDTQRPTNAWLLDLTTPVAAADLAALTAVLDAGERQRAARLLKPHDHEPFIAAHALLRAALSTFIPKPPDAWAFMQVGHHKPQVFGEDGVDFDFSLTHCPGFGACAVTRGGKVGIDIEPLRPVLDVNAYRRVLSTDELQTLQALPPAAADRRFWRIWTAKEAIGKATGHGVAERLTGVTVTPTDTGFDVTGQSPLPLGTVRPLDCGPAYVGAIATDSDRPIDVRRMTVPELLGLLGRA